MFARQKKLELHPLPMNMPEFDKWSERIIQKAQVPTKNIESQKWVLAAMITQSSPTDFFRPDEYYVNLLRKAASDQVAISYMEEVKLKRAKEQQEQQKLADVTAKKPGLKIVTEKDEA